MDSPLYKQPECRSGVMSKLMALLIVVVGIVGCLKENISYLGVLMAAEIAQDVTVNFPCRPYEPSMRVEVNRLTRKEHLPPNGE